MRYSLILILNLITNSIFSQNLYFIGKPLSSTKTKIDSLNYSLLSLKHVKIYHFESQIKYQKLPNFNFDYKSQSKQKKYSLDSVYKITQLIDANNTKRRPTYIYALNDGLSDFEIGFNKYIVVKNLSRLVQLVKTEKKCHFIILFNPNSITISIEEPNRNNSVNNRITRFNISIFSNAALSNVKYKISSNRYFDSIEINNLTLSNNKYSFSKNFDLFTVPPNTQFFIELVVIDNEGNEKKEKLGPFLRIESSISTQNCYFKHYDKNNQNALIRNFKSTDRYWFPIYSSVDPSNLLFVLKNKFGEDHKILRLHPNENYVYGGGPNEYCLAISGKDLDLNPPGTENSTCNYDFDGIIILRHIENSSESAPIELYFGSYDSDFKWLLLECSK